MRTNVNVCRMRSSRDRRSQNNSPEPLSVVLGIQSQRDKLVITRRFEHARRRRVRILKMLRQEH